MTRAFFERLTLWREVLLENMLPALVAPIVWMILVSFTLGMPFIRKLALIAVGHLGAMISVGGAGPHFARTPEGTVTKNRSAACRGTILGGALLRQLALPFYAARMPGLVGQTNLAAIGATFPALLYALRYRRFRKRQLAAG